jgi:hypothetical protein
MTTKNGLQKVISIFKKESLLEQYTKIVNKVVGLKKPGSTVIQNQSNSRFNVFKRPRNPADSSVSSKGSLENILIKPKASGVPTLHLNISEESSMVQTPKQSIKPHETKPKVATLE